MLGGKQNNHVPIAVVKNALDIRRYVQEELPGGKITGNEYIAKNPMRPSSDGSGAFSINLNTGAWADFADGTTRGSQGGDVVSLHAYLNGLSNGQAADDLAGKYNITDYTRPIQGNPEQHKEPPKYIQFVPIPKNTRLPNGFPMGKDPVTNEWRVVKWNYIWPYHDEAGDITHYVIRIDKPADTAGGKPKKDFYPLLFVKNISTGKYGWHWKYSDIEPAFTKHQLYALHLLTAHTDVPVLLVSGEKCADAANAVFERNGWPWVATTWQGGDKGTAKANFKQLNGRTVTCWPDNDESCQAAIKRAASSLDNPKILIPPSDKPSGWDVADAIKEGWTDERVLQFISAAQPLLPNPDNIIRSHQDMVPREMFPHYTDRGLKGTIENVMALLDYYGIKLRYNMVLKSIECNIPGVVLGHDDAMNVLYAHVFSLCKRNSVQVGGLESYIGAIASINEYNPVAEWIMSKPWDGKKRVQDLCDTLEIADDTPIKLRDIYINKWIVSAVAAAFRNNSDDYRNRGTLILQGAGSIGKTTWFRTLAGGRQWFGEGMTLDPSDKDSVMKAIGHWIVELGEIESTLKKDMPKLKAFLTNGEDELRRPFAKAPGKYPRRTVFAGTVNSIEFLTDDIGNDRFWCIPVVSINYDLLNNIDIQQLWAEVKVRYDEGAQWWLTIDEMDMLAEQNAKHEITNTIEERLEEMLDWEADDHKWRKITPTGILMECGIKEPNRSDATLAGRYLRKRTGCEPIRKSGKDQGRWYLLPPLKKKEIANDNKEPWYRVV